MPPGRFEVSGGASWVGGYPLGSADATLTRNQSAERFVLFHTESEMSAGPAVDARLAYHLNDDFAVEAAFGYSRPRARVSISRDAEGAPDATFEAEKLSQYAVDGSVVIGLPWELARGRARPFVRAGAAYLRQLHQGRTFVETGEIYHAGGGMKWLIGRPFRGFGLRADVEAAVRTNGFDLQNRRRIFSRAGGSLFLRF